MIIDTAHSQKSQNRQVDELFYETSFHPKYKNLAFSPQIDKKESITKFLKLIAQLNQNINSLYIKQNIQSCKFLLFSVLFIVKQSKSFACIPQTGLCVDKNDLRKE